MILTLALSPIVHAAQTAETPSPGIVLNGITTIFGDKRALFKVWSPDREQLCFLAEGQRDGDILLLAVDMRAGKIKIRDHGVVQVVSMCQPPALALAGKNSAPIGDTSLPADSNGLATAPADNTPTTGTEFQNTNSVTTSQTVSQVGAANAKSDSTADTGTAANNTGSENSGAANANAPKPDPWWVVGSKAIEKARIQSADLIASGKADPEPLTPLTPPGTPAYLIGPDQVFFQHM